MLDEDGDVCDGTGRLIVRADCIHAYDIDSPAFSRVGNKMAAQDDGGEANAKLIAAAPQMAEALKAILRDNKHRRETFVDFDIVRTALANAGIE